MSEKSTTGKELGTIILGIITTIVTAIVCSWVEINWDFAIYSFMLFFIIPVGAVGAGMAAASGYYFGAQVLHLPISKRLTFNIVFASIGAFFLIKYIPYYFLKVDGVLFRDFIDFFSYLRYALTNVSYSLVRFKGSTGEIVGSWGYGIAFLQPLGFTGAGLYISSLLKEKPFCKECSKYYSKKYSKSVYSSEPETTLKNFAALVMLMSSKTLIGQVGKQHKEFGSEHPPGHHLSLVFVILQCDCKNNYLSLKIQKQTSDVWEDVDKVYVITKQKIPLKY